MRLYILLTLVLIALVVPATASAQSPLAHSAAVCADYPNQAAAQRAADTRDSDGDGVYCESLPCPCAGPGSTGGGSQQPARKPKPAKPPALFAGKCRRGRLPDRSCSPGKVATTDVNRICTPGYSGRVRSVSERTKNSVYYRYGIRRHTTGQYEVDHIISLELGGSNSIKNLYPEAASPRPGFHEKDRLENTLHRLVCSGELGLRTAQKAIATNWVKAYKRYVVNAARASAAATRSCAPPNHPGRIENIIANLKARGVSCKTARVVSSKVRAGTKNPSGFSCRTREGDGFADFTCRRPAKRISFRIIVF